MIKKNFFVLIVLVTSIILLLNILNAQQVSYCCEKTKSGAWCQNAPQDSCDVSNGLRKAPTSCDATSYCKMGYCYDSQEGTCAENTPQKVCQLNGGVWEENNGQVPAQCSLGCCILEDQSAFVTQTRCKKLSSFYGLETDFRSNIKTEVECISSASPGSKGACVYQKDNEKTCSFTTRGKCNDLKTTNSGNSTSDVAFYENTLCSDEKLGTNCGPSEKTTCVEGKDETYFVDTCGNVANVYDASKIKDKTYWSKVVPKQETCNSNSANANSATCGNCDYFLGSVCKNFDRSQDKVKPNYGDSICRDLSCQYEGKTYKHGETWCADSQGIKTNLPGSRAFRLVCYEGEVSVEPCADFRQEVCLQSDINGFKNAACRANLWQDCFSQTTQKNCENTDKRDCVWNPNIILNDQTQANVNPSGTTSGNLSHPFTGSSSSTSSTSTSTTSNKKQVKGACLPKYSPGFNFWEQGSAQGICSLASKECIIKYEKTLTGGKKCVSNCECLSASWASQMNNACVSLGDCGVKTNYIGAQGYNTLDDSVKKSSGGKGTTGN